MRAELLAGETQHQSPSKRHKRRCRKTMKALVYTEPKKLVMQDWPQPELGSGEALVRVRAVAVCGSDVHGWLGTSRGRVPSLVLGHELAGVVEQISGEGAVAKPGDRVAV